MRASHTWCTALLLLASTSAYGEGNWSSHDPFLSEFYARMNNYQPEHFWYDQSFQAMQQQRRFLRGSSRLEALRPRWDVKFLGLEFTIELTDDARKGNLRFEKSFR